MKKNNDGNLGGFADVGEVDMFGLDEFGEPAGGDSMWGAVIGGGIGTGVAIITRAMTKTPGSKLHNYSEAVGLVAGGIAGGVLMAFPGSRRMGLAAIATAFVTNGLRQLEQSLFPPVLTAAQASSIATTASTSSTGTAPVTSSSTTTPAPNAGWGGVTIDPTAVIRPGQGFGIATIEPGYAVNGLGAPVIDRAYPVPGSIHGGFGGSRPELVGPPTLVGAGDYGMSENPGAQQTKLLGGPNVSAMGAHFGATLFGHSN